jgi:hypothetical protein
MPLKRLLIVAVAALGLSLSGYAASAGPVVQTGADQSAVAKSVSTFTLIKGGRGGGAGRSGGGRGMGGHRSMGHHMGGRSMSMRGGRGFRGRGHRRGGWYDGYDCDLPFPSPFCWY